MKNGCINLNGGIQPLYLNPKNWAISFISQGFSDQISQTKVRNEAFDPMG